MRVLRSKSSMICLILSLGLALFLPPAAQAAFPVTFTDATAEYLAGVKMPHLNKPIVGKHPVLPFVPSSGGPREF